jgi:hypothetical protein
MEGPVGPSAFWKVTNGIGDIGSSVEDHMDDEDDDDDDDDEDYDDEQDDDEEGEPIFGTIITISI